MKRGETCWTLVNGAAAGDAADRERFAEVYLPVVRSYLAARLGGRRRAQDLDDAVQLVFVECLREGGVLEGAAAKASRGFGAYLYGVSRNIARRLEAGEGVQALAEGEEGFDVLPSPSDPASHVFQRGWAQALIAEAARMYRERARDRGPAAGRRVELLEMRFGRDLPIREIAKLWNMEPARLHHDYAKAREEFREALREVLAFHHPGAARNVEEELHQLLLELGS